MARTLRREIYRLNISNRRSRLDQLLRETDRAWLTLNEPILKAYSPELNPVERLWAWLPSHQLSNRVYADYDELLRETDRAWLTPNEPILKSVCACPWIERAIQS